MSPLISAVGVRWFFVVFWLVLRCFSGGLCQLTASRHVGTHDRYFFLLWKNALAVFGQSDPAQQREC